MMKAYLSKKSLCYKSFSESKRNMQKNSVCMATYNGEEYILEQIKSILDQLKEEDELIVVDDCSKDATVKLIESMNDPRINIFLNKINRGVNYSFERALYLAKNDFIFLSDQDDIWINGRVSLMLSKINDTGCFLVSSNQINVDKCGKIIIHQGLKLTERDSSSNFKNIFKIFTGRAPYYGCAMLLNKKILNLILPIPSYVESHDLWIALAANLTGNNAHIVEETLYRRIHDNNYSLERRPFIKKLWSRIIFGISIIVLLIRYYKLKRREVL